MSAPFLVATAARGDAAELLDASGAPFALYSYDACGNPGAVLTDATARIPAALAQAIAEANALRYAGYAYDAHSGLYYLSKRHYDPATAQFLTKDPAKADGEESPYQYCGGDPVGKVDPSGEYCEETWYEWRTSLWGSYVRLSDWVWWFDLPAKKFSGVFKTECAVWRQFKRIGYWMTLHAVTARWVGGRRRIIHDKLVSRVPVGDSFVRCQVRCEVWCTNLTAFRPPYSKEFVLTGPWVKGDSSTHALASPAWSLGKQGIRRAWEWARSRVKR
ncbi:MAG: RHS repeat-associated core domain-containing protein [Anaerosomatales bacterium]|nr:RHS repeat-associated core domain-containing protein [Anaerosomatales bacterium]